ncbi:MAG TPA: hypothetical protein VEC18_09010, partial [Myxococcota bacterium]|nr:hypothetical protein [Myxococcota bacterium]
MKREWLPLIAALVASQLAGVPARSTRAAETDAWAAAPGESLDGADAGMSIDPLLTAIEDLESSRDAKCHSSANRFEDFLFGTPLSEAARSAGVALQVELVRGIWARASA